MTDSLFPGQRLGRYQLVRPAGQGGMATVWLARLVGSRGFHKPVAVKMLLPAIREDREAERMFQSEAALASRIRHPNVVEILDLGEEQDVLYLVMEWIHGEPLSVALPRAAKVGGVPLGMAIRIGAQVSAGLHAAHELRDEDGKLLGLVHRDVSPQNVLVGFNGMVKLVDFGIAKATAEATHLTEMGTVRGKIPYMAPEQIKFEQLDRRTDVFAAGVLLYVLTTGRHPFKREGRSETALAICTEDPALPTSFVPNYPERLERVILRALAKRPEDRYATAQEFGDDLLRTMPPLRGTPQEELQKYMAELMPDRLAHHQDLIRQALGVQAVSPSPAGLIAKSAHSSSTLRAVSVSDPSSSAREPALLEVASAAPSDPALRATLRPRARVTRTVLAIAAGAVIGAVAIAAVTRSRPGAAIGTGASRPEEPLPVRAQPTATVAPKAPDPIAEGAPDAGANDRAALESAGRGKVSPDEAAVKRVRHLPVRHAAPRPAQAAELKDPYGH